MTTHDFCRRVFYAREALLSRGLRDLNGVTVRISQTDFDDLAVEVEQHDPEIPAFYRVWTTTTNRMASVFGHPIVVDETFEPDRIEVRLAVAA